MKTTRLPYLLLTIFGIVGVALLSYFFILETEDLSEGTKGENEQIELSKYPGVDIITNTMEEETYHKAIHYPKFEGEQLNHEINEYLESSQQSFREELAKKDKQRLKMRPANFYITFDIYPVEEQLYSIVFSEESYFGGANSLQSTRIFLADVSKDQSIKQTDIINDTKETREKLYALLLNAFKEHETYSDYLFEEDLKSWIDRKDNTFSNMYLTNKAMVFKFDKYEVTAGVAGMPEIELPYDQVREILSTEWVERLEIKGSVGNAEIDQPKEEVTEKETDNKGPAKVEGTTGKRVALTFDDGPHPENTVKIVDLLERYDAKATFFMLGSRVDFYPNIVKKMAEAGHELGNHTWNHKDLTLLSSDQIELEVKDTNRIIQEATGQIPSVFRPPYGATNKSVESVIGIPSVLWTIDTLDWKSHDPNQVLKIVQDNVKDGSIILMHDIHGSTVEAVELVLKYLQKEGYQCVTVSEVL
ncbi:polysaccharide deacetylase family protein [Bacillus sp. PS06]|uniref:polysaccharide deacetylase family protein n=1 Tax=Bacillus sp. PS06 TaxID=2764176 RepID=UPI0017873A37|nr:polysaccharide deacetylase family protein [Bacillus sp. PS06]MBD8069694.1 polysaccharide deacetylase family protein [Bacillus sp. PS06]